MEVWKDIPGFEGKYQASNLGNIKSLHYRKSQTEHLLSQCTSRHGYRQVRMSGHDGSKIFMVHRLVAKAFVQNPGNKREVNHINGIKTDNRVENLEWCSSSANKIHAYKTGLKRTVPILQFDLNGKFIKEWDSLRQAENALGIQYTNIAKCCRKERHQAGGYIWEFKGDRAENPEWCENREFAVRAAKPGFGSSKKVFQYDKSGNFIKSFNSVTEAQAETKISHISCCCIGDRKTAGGYTWRYKEVE